MSDLEKLKKRSTHKSKIIDALLVEVGQLKTQLAGRENVEVVLRESLKMIVYKLQSKSGGKILAEKTLGNPHISEQAAKIQAVIDAVEKFQLEYEDIVGDPNSIAITLDVLFDAVRACRGELC